MKTQSVKRLVLSALFAALTCTATALLHLSSPLGGYLHLGDCFVLLGAFLLPPLWGVGAGALGSALADLLLGYSQYIPATLLIKALTVLAAHALFLSLGRRRLFGAAVGAAAGELLMAAGYFIFEWFLYGIGGSTESLLSVNLPQAGLNALAAVLLLAALQKTKIPQIIGGYET